MISEAAINNAEWCDAMCRAHGHPGNFGRSAWTNGRRTPLYYPDAVTLSADASVRDVLDGIDRSTPGASVKDSFACLDLTAEGFRPLFEARWIHRPGWLPAPEVAVPADTSWRPVRDAAELAAWAMAWSGGDADEAALFRAELLADPATKVVAGYGADGRITGGAVLTDNWRVTGVSNLFAAEGTDPVEAWAGCLSLVDAGSPVVGYESGDDLPPALAVGFEELGPLRVWLATDA
ncbi:hypothetical protein ACGFYP_12185 [Streptomyces sp. NPDC048370]|uniref:hypothetical protein n=1 Tax=Streptomyces sp. NPDC048370 TaxID=3365540 RepID=UPI003719BF63